MDEQPTVDFSEGVDQAAVEAAEDSPAGPESAARGPGLGTKFFVAAVLLVVATLGTAIALTTWRANVVAERSIREGLERVPTMFRAYRADVEDRLRAQLRSLAEEPGTKALYAPEVSEATRYDFAREQAGLLEADAVFMFDAAGVVLARSDKAEGEGLGRSFAGVSWVGDPLWRRRDASAAVIQAGELALVASVAVTSGEAEEMQADGALAAIFSFGEDEVATLKGITRGEVAFLSDVSRRSEPPAPKATAASDGFSGVAVIRGLSELGASSRLFEEGQDVGPLDVEVDGQKRLLLALPIKNTRGRSLGAFVVTRSRSEETAAFREIGQLLLAIGLGALLLSFPISFLMGRRIARPLEQLTRGALAIREGQLDVELPQQRRDEVGALARAFRGMLGELKEKRALQELLEEMRRRPAPEPGPAVTPGEASTEAGGPEVGRNFGGRYQVLSKLGAGGMGQVFQANDLELDDVVALKVLSDKAFSSNSAAVETLKREIRLARRITHPNVVRVHDLGEAQAVRFVSMEYVPGTTLRAVMKQRGALALGPGLQILKQVCRGLAAIHHAGIVHRDMKPENAMVLPDGTLKLMDFGIAEVVESGADGERSQTVTGTPQYMSPEQLRGERLDGRSDLYAVGVIMYEMFTGISPFGGKTVEEIVRKTVQMVPADPREQRPDMPQGLSDLILGLLAKQADARPRSAAQVHDVLLEVVS